jgi:hypothetical protein
MPYQLTTTKPYPGGTAVDLALVLAPGKVMAVTQVPRATLELKQWTHPGNSPVLTWVGSSPLGTGSVPTAVSVAPTDAALAYHVVGTNAVRLGWLSIGLGSFVTATGPSLAGGRVSIAGFASTGKAPKTSAGPRPVGPDGAVTVGPAGRRVVTAFNNKANPDAMRLTFWNVPYATTTTLDAPAVYRFLSTNPARRASVVGLREMVDGIWLRSADALVAFANATDRLRLRQYRLETAAGGSISLVGSASTTDLVQEVAALAVPTGDRMIVVTAVVTAAGQLKLIAWKIAVAGPPVFWFEQAVGSAKHVELTLIGNRDFATGVVDPAGKASTRFWRLPNLRGSAPQCEHLATTESTSNAKAIRLVHQPGPGKQLGTTFVATLLQNGTFKLRGHRLTEA